MISPEQNKNIKVLIANLIKENSREKYLRKYSDSDLANQDSKIGRAFISLSNCSSKIKFAFIKAKSDIVAMSDEMMNCITSSFHSMNTDACNSSSDKDNTEIIKNSEEFKKDFNEVIVYYREPILIEIISYYKTQFANEVIGCYMHNQASKIVDHTISCQKAAIVSLKFSEKSDDFNDNLRLKIKSLADLISMSLIANESASVLFKEELNKDDVENFKNKTIQELKESGKPENVINKIIDGQMKKFFESNTLICSPLMSPSKLEWLQCSDEISIEEAILKASKILGVDISISFYRVLRSL